jgi:hypothetical protein
VPCPAELARELVKPRVPWSEAEVAALRTLVARYGEGKWTVRTCVACEHLHRLRLFTRLFASVARAAAAHRPFWPTAAARSTRTAKTLRS